jgi:hypothetical protein
MDLQGYGDVLDLLPPEKVVDVLSGVSTQKWWDYKPGPADLGAMVWSLHQSGGILTDKNLQEMATTGQMGSCRVDDEPEPEVICILEDEEDFQPQQRRVGSLDYSACLPCITKLMYI